MLQGWTPVVGHIFTWVAAAILCLAALHDVLARTLPDWMATVLAAIGIADSLVGGRLIASLLVGAAVFILSGLCWKRGWLGGGDVKLLGAVAILVPPLAVPHFIAAMAVAGGILSLIYLAVGRFVPRTILRRPIGHPAGLLSRAVRLECWRLSRGGPLPYAVAIATGGLLVLL